MGCRSCWGRMRGPLRRRSARDLPRWAPSGRVPLLSPITTGPALCVLPCLQGPGWPGGAPGGAPVLLGGHLRAGGEDASASRDSSDSDSSLASASSGIVSREGHKGAAAGAGAAAGPVEQPAAEQAMVQGAGSRPTSEDNPSSDARDSTPSTTAVDRGGNSADRKRKLGGVNATGSVVTSRQNEANAAIAEAGQEKRRKAETGEAAAGAPEAGGSGPQQPQPAPDLDELNKGLPPGKESRASVLPGFPARVPRSRPVAGWKALLDSNTRNVYYANLESKKVSWTRP